MCIIVAKPAGVTMPEFSVFENCFRGNPDGAGLMIASDGKVYGRKGLMSIKAFNDALNDFETLYGDLKSHTMVFHFRIGTHGTNSPYNTHPFPLIPNSHDYDTFKSLNWVADQGFAHNGILSSLGMHPDVKTHDVSDTMVFGKRIALLLAEHYNIANDTEPQFLLNQMLGTGTSKFAFIDGDGNLFTIGNFNQENGVMYSNYSYRAYSYRSYNSGFNNSFSKYFDDDDTYYGRPYSTWNSGYKNTYSNSAGSDSNIVSIGSKKSSSDSKKSTKLKRAEELGIHVLKKDAVIMCFDEVEMLDGYELEKLIFAYSDTGIIYYWSKGTSDWEIYSAPEGGFALFSIDDNELIFNCLDIEDEIISECYNVPDEGDDGWYTGGKYTPEKA